MTTQTVEEPAAVSRTFESIHIRSRETHMDGLTSIDGSKATIGRGGPISGIPKFNDPYQHRKWVLERMAGAFRVMARKGYTEGTAGHISVRDPVDPDTFWINSLGQHFALIKASDLTQINMKGEIVGGNKAAVNNAGFHIHSAIHEARPDINAACHFHSLYGKAWSSFGKPLEMLTQDACAFYKDHAIYSSFGGIALEASEGRKIAEALGGKRAAILQNHGLLTTGQTVDEAAFLYIAMENSCKVQLLVEAAAANGIAKTICPADEAEYTYRATSPEAMWLEFQPEFQYEVAMSRGEFLF